MMLNRHKTNRDTVWINSSDGVVRKTEDRCYNNNSFVDMIHQDKTALGYMMSMRYPTSTTTRLLGDGIPPSWSQWDIPELSASEIISDVSNQLSSWDIEEIDGMQRLWVPRKEQSQRLRAISRFAGFSVTPRGIVSCGVPQGLIDCITQVVAGVYAIIERNTIASIRSKNKTSVSSARVKKMNTCFDIVSRRDRVAEAVIISSYSEPSATTALRLFYLYDVLGKDLAHHICDGVYYGLFEDQLYSIEESMLNM